MTTLLEAAKTLIKVLELEKSQIVLSMTSGRALEELEQAIEREKAKPRNEAEVINDLTPTRRSCANCKFEPYDKLEAPCLPCRFYSNWEPKP